MSPGTAREWIYIGLIMARSIEPHELQQFARESEFFEAIKLAENGHKGSLVKLCKKKLGVDWDGTSRESLVAAVVEAVVKDFMDHANVRRGLQMAFGRFDAKA